jgi:hypothetical protein
MTGLPWMRLPTSELPKGQGGLELRPEEEEIVNQELFPEVAVHLASVDARQMLSSIPSVGQADASSGSYFLDKPRTPSPTWFTRNFDFVHLGWARAVSRVRLACKALILILHRHHDPNDDTRPWCPACNNSIDRHVSTLAESEIHRAASAEVHRSLGA